MYLTLHRLTLLCPIRLIVKSGVKWLLSHPSSVATDRGGNERGVNVCKRAWFVSRGFLPNMSPKQLNDAWITSAYQANFMFNPVL